MNVPPPLTVADRLALTLDGLCRAVAARIAGGGLAAVMIVMIWRRVRRTDQRIQALLARFRAGRLWRRGAVRCSGRVGRSPVGAGARLPCGYGWLLKLMPHEAACFAGQVEGVLADPEMVALLEVSEQARRVLRPLCRMLGVELPSPAAVAPVTAGGLVREWPDAAGVAVVGGGPDDVPARWSG